MTVGFRWAAAALCAFVLGHPAAAQAPDASPLAAAASPEAVGFSSERLKRLDAAMAKAVADGQVPGMVTLLARHGQVVSVKAYGERTPGQPMTRDTVFRVYSMTKPVTGVAMMILFEEGRWRLDDPVTKFIPEFKDLKVVTGLDAAGKPVLEPLKRPPTMRELMSHTAGFAYGLDTNTPADKIFADLKVFESKGMAQLIQRISQAPLVAQPGERLHYSAAVDVQGYLVEKLSGRPFGQFLQERIFAPLKMVDTGFSLPPADRRRLVAAYATDPKTGKTVPAEQLFRGPLPDLTRPPDVESGGGGLVSTLDDYARFAQMLANEGELDGVRLLSPATVELMGTNVVPDRALATAAGWGFGPNVGFGMDVMVVNNPRAAGRLEGPGTMSWGGAAGTWFWSDPANQVVFVGMIQHFGRSGDGGFDALTRPLVYQALVDPAK